MSYSNRKMVVGSTPLAEHTSHVLRTYGESDARIFEVPARSAAARPEITWQHIEWEPDRPDTARFRCPHCARAIPDLTDGWSGEQEGGSAKADPYSSFLIGLREDGRR